MAETNRTARTGSTGAPARNAADAPGPDGDGRDPLQAGIEELIDAAAARMERGANPWAPAGGDDDGPDDGDEDRFSLEEARAKLAALPPEVRRFLIQQELIRAAAGERSENVAVMMLQDALGNNRDAGQAAFGPDQGPVQPAPWQSPRPMTPPPAPNMAPPMMPRMMPQPGPTPPQMPNPYAFAQWEAAMRAGQNQPAWPAPQAQGQAMPADLLTRARIGNQIYDDPLSPLILPLVTAYLANQPQTLKPHIVGLLEADPDKIGRLYGELRQRFHRNAAAADKTDDRMSGRRFGASRRSDRAPDLESPGSAREGRGEEVRRRENVRALSEKIKSNQGTAKDFEKLLELSGALRRMEGRG